MTAQCPACGHPAHDGPCGVNRAIHDGIEWCQCPASTPPESIVTNSNAAAWRDGTLSMPCAACEKKDAEIKRLRGLLADAAEKAVASYGHWLAWKARAEEAEAERDALAADAKVVCNWLEQVRHRSNEISPDSEAWLHVAFHLRLPPDVAAAVERRRAK